MKNYMQANRFLQKYGPDAFEIIASYEEAADIPPNERYANWYGDYGIFEPSLNEDMTYDKLLSRYKVGLKYLGIIHEQTKAVCGNFLSEQLAEHIREQLGRHNADAEYRPTSIITKMDTPEFTRDMLAVDRDMEVDCDIGHQITCYLETWFDVDKKFGTNTAADDDKWLNLYAKYDPFADTLRLEFTVTTADSCEEGEYMPTETEAQLVKDMIAEKLKRYLKEQPIVTVRLVNYKISVIGEVNHPGIYTVNNEQVNLLEAIAMAGDLTIYGKRNNVRIIRKENNRQRLITINLNDVNVIHSSDFYLHQNDIVYVEPNKAKTQGANIGSSTNLLISITSILISMAGLIVTILR